jgi:hypothetical protein
VFAAGLNLLNQLLEAGDLGVLLKSILNGEVAGKWDSLSVDLSVSSLVDQLGNGLSVWNSVGDPWFDDSKHVHGGLVILEEDGVVNLQKSQKSKNFLWLRGESVNTLNSDNKENCWFSWNVDGTLFLGLHQLNLFYHPITALALLTNSC